MSDAEVRHGNSQRRRRYWPRRKRWQFLLVLLGLLAISSMITWRSRETIADDLIESELARLGIEASYEIGRIGATRQVLRDFVVGDPERPDLVIERVEVVPVIGFTGPRIGTLRLVRPRLRASFRDGKLSLGALDPLLEIEADGPPGLPEWRLELVDARARIFTDHGVLGAKASGSGWLDNGFEGVLAIAGPELEAGGCRIEQPQLAGRISVARGRPSFAGPLSLREATCPAQDARAERLTLAASVEGEADFSAWSAQMKLGSGPAALGDISGEALAGSLALDWRDGLANARFDLDAGAVRSPVLALSTLGVEGALRLRPEEERLEVDAGFSGRAGGLGEAARSMLAGWQRSSGGTLAEPLLARLERALAAAIPASQLSGELTYRRSEDGFTLHLPAARLRDTQGESLIAASQVQFSTRTQGAPRLAGNFATGGAGLPRVRARMQRGSDGSAVLQMQMAPYRSGKSLIAVPRLTIAQTAAQSWHISGLLEAGGPVPGGEVAGLSVPLEGRWWQRGGLALGTGCLALGVRRLQLAELILANERVPLCPGRSGAIVRFAGGQASVSGVIRALRLEGRLGESPATIEAGAIELASDRQLTASDIAVTLSSGDARSALAIARLQASLEGAPRGSFSGLTGRLANVPLVIASGAGDWRLADGRLLLDRAGFELQDSEAQARFYPLVARDASLALAGDAITAEAQLLHPASGRLVAEVDLVHDLSSGAGFADLEVPGLVFDERLQPDELTYLAEGVIALASGEVTGSGRIAWDASGVTSSGEFSSEGFDFAAAFGPVKRVSGTVRFSDLINLTTDGRQSLAIGSINPGVEVFDGTLDFALNEGTLLSLEGGRWPFFGGTMILRPARLDLSASEERSYVIELVGVDAAQFVAAMELGNINMTGIFDGTVPIVFDEKGNGQIVGGLLISRPPGGNLSYIGELTYEDTGAIANFAFQSLRSLDFSQMMVEMNGPLTGEIVTRIVFDGVRQGEGAHRNFLTRQLARIPIRFRVNIRAPFYQLITSLKATYDPAFIRDPRDLGLLDVEGNRLVRPGDRLPVPDAGNDGPSELSPAKQPIQTDESETLP